MDIDTEFAELLSALDAISDRVDQWAQPSAVPEPAPTSGADRAAAAVSGSDPNAAEERSIRGAAASLARERAWLLRDELVAVRERAGAMAEQARTARVAAQTVRAAGARPGRVGTALRAAAAQLADCEDADQAMSRIVTGALHVITTAQWGGVCVQGRSRGERAAVSVHAASDPIVDQLEELQSRDGEGPCVQALATADTVYVPDLLVERRWPYFARIAGELGVRSVLAVGLPVSTPGGVLNLYSPHPDGFDEQARAVLEVFADHAAIALAGARRVGSLTRAVESRDVIGQAKGILIHRHAVGPERAFQMLVEASQHANLKLVAVARLIVENPTVL